MEVNMARHNTHYIKVVLDKPNVPQRIEVDLFSGTHGQMLQMYQNLTCESWSECGHYREVILEFRDIVDGKVIETPLKGFKNE